MLNHVERYLGRKERLGGDPQQQKDGIVFKGIQAVMLGSFVLAAGMLLASGTFGPGR